MSKKSVGRPTERDDGRYTDPFVALEKTITELIRLAGVRFDGRGKDVETADEPSGRT